MRMAVRRIQLEETAEEQRASGSADSSVLLRLHRLAAGLSHERLSEPARISSGGIGPWTRSSAHVGRSTLHGYRVKLMLRWLIAVTSSLEVVDCREWILSPARPGAVTMRLKRVRRAIHRHPEAKVPPIRTAMRLDGGARSAIASALPKLERIEVDRLDQGEGASLERDRPIEYERDDLAQEIDYLATFPQDATARDLAPTGRT
jgi:hypothetical protein